MIEATSSIEVDIHDLAAEAVKFLAIRAVLRAFFDFSTECTNVGLVDSIYIH
jgi:hypothetical protein